MRRLELLCSRLIDELETERQQVASFINDSAVQSLGALHIQLTALHTELADEGARELVEPLALLADLTVALQTQATELRPLGLDIFDLNTVLEQICTEFAAVSSFDVAYRGIEIPGMASASRVAFYRLLLEALANVHKHANASRIQVVLESDGHCATLSIADNGQGFAAGCEIGEAYDAPGPGLFGLMFRFQQLHGRIIIRSHPGAGTVISAVLPLA